MPSLSARGKALRSEWVIAVRGVVEDRVANGGSVNAARDGRRRGAGHRVRGLE